MPLIPSNKLNDQLENNFFLHRDEIEDLKEIFSVMKDENDKVNTQELYEGFKMMGYDRTMPRIFSIVDELKESSSEFKEDEFMQEISSICGHRYSSEGRAALFKLVTKEGSDEYTKEDLMELIQKSGDIISQMEIEEMIKKFSNNNSTLNEQAFSSMMARNLIA